jgi:hypothetical protein
MADAVAELSDAIVDVSGPGQLKAIRASIVEHECVHRRQLGAELRSHLIEGAIGRVYRDIQEKPGIGLVGERFDFAQARRQLAGSEQTYDGTEDLIQARRCNRALLDGAERL